MGETTTNRTWSDQKMEILIAGLLRAGVLLSAVVVLGGAVVYLARNGDSPINYRTFHSEPAEFRSIAGVLKDVFALRGRGIIQLGLLLLIATPVARVAFSILGFAKEGDRLYAIVASIVLLILLYSLIFS
ncbi:MAG: DUF1634 domain-containing protein [Candidatus Sulfotelmatobacter sp.]|jgi:uncharacterized membrane protein